MRDPLLPQILLASGLGLSLSYTARPVAIQSVAIMTVATIVTALFPLTTLPQDPIFALAWLSVAATAATVHLPDAMRLRADPWLSRGLALNGGIWAGLLSHLAITPLSLGLALPFLVLAFGGLWLVGRGWGISVKVAASWLIAIALLQVGLGLVPTPGYAPDHMD